MASAPHIVTLGMFIIDEFEYLDEQGNKTGQIQVGGGGTYAAIGARIWLPAEKIGMIVDRGHDFPGSMQDALDQFGADMWLFRDNTQRCTTRALNLYKGEQRNFRYMTPRVRLTPEDLHQTRLAKPTNLHFICSPSRAATILSSVEAIADWDPVTIYEPIPDSCVPGELPALINILPVIEILSPNAEEALSLLSLPHPPTRALVEQACKQFLDIGVGRGGHGHVIIRSGAMGAYVASRARAGMWVDAFWSMGETDRVVDVTGAGNSFLGGLSAGLLLKDDDVFEAVFYAAVSASFIIEQLGLPRLTYENDGQIDLEKWNGDSPTRRLTRLRACNVVPELPST